MISKIVYYAPREEKTWTVHSSCKLPPEPKVMRHTEAENDTFTFLRRAGMGYFRPGVMKVNFILPNVLKNILIAK